jgi:Domain of unknown function (DUF4437)
MMFHRTATFILGALAAISVPALASEPPGITLAPPSALDWVTTPDGVAFAALEGDRFTGPYQSMVRLPAGVASPLHVKSANMFGVVIQGEMIHYAKGEDANTARKIGVGAFYKVPKELAHISACVSDVACIVYLYQDGAFDFVPVAQ